MVDIIVTMLGLVGVIGAVWLMIIPVQILNEIKRQGAAREAESVRITALLRIIAGVGTDRSVPAQADPLQSAIDNRSCKFG